MKINPKLITNLRRTKSYKTENTKAATIKKIWKPRANKVPKSLGRVAIKYVTLKSCCKVNWKLKTYSNIFCCICMHFLFQSCYLFPRNDTSQIMDFVMEILYYVPLTKSSKAACHIWKIEVLLSRSPFIYAIIVP